MSLGEAVNPLERAVDHVRTGVGRWYSRLPWRQDR